MTLYKSQEKFWVEVDIVTSYVQPTKLLVPLVLPHEVFAEICSHDDVFRESYFGGSPRDFWEKVAFEFPDHPVVQGPQCTRETAVPLGLHGDGACFTKTKMDGLECISWNSILAPAGDSVNTHILAAVIPTDIIGPHTVRQVCEALAWSFACLMDGLWPRTDHMGQPLCGHRAERAGQPLSASGVTGWIIDYRGDMSWIVKHWELPTWSNRPHMCGFCFAQDPEWANLLDADPPTRTTAELLQHTTNPFAQLAGFNRGMIRIDPMHTLKMGVCRLTIASAILDLLDRGHFTAYGNRRQLRLHCAFKAFVDWCATTRTSSGVDTFTPGRLGLGDVWPEAGYKAQNCRILVKWLAHEASTAADADANNDTRCLALHLSALDNMFNIMETCKSRHFSDSELHDFVHAGGMACATTYCLLVLCDIVRSLGLHVLFFGLACDILSRPVRSSDAGDAIVSQ